MRYFIIGLLMICTINCSKNSREKPLSYNEFVLEFPTLDQKVYALTPKIMLMPYLRDYKTGYSRVVNPELQEKFLVGDLSTFYKYTMNDSAYLNYEAVKPFGKMAVGQFDIFLYHIIPAGDKKHTYDSFRMGIFKNEKLTNSFNIALSALPSVRNLDDLYLVTATISENKINQYKIAIQYHEEPNDFELGNEDYYFTLQDTLAVSTLEIQVDGSVLGKNLAELPDNK